MARTLPDQAVPRPWRALLQLPALGAAAGLAQWITATLLSRYVIEPLACRQVAQGSLCLDSTVVAGNIATILTAILVVILLIRWRVARPIIVAVAPAIVLWDISAWTAGLWGLEALAWAILLYGVAYALFGWIARRLLLWQAVGLSLAIVIAVRVLLVV